MAETDAYKIRIAKRIAKELKQEDNYLFVNLGVGIPTMVTDYLEGDNVFIQAENGMLGVGRLAGDDEGDNQLINASRQLVMPTPGCSFIDSSVSFGMIRGGHIDVTVIGALEVDEEGTVANWIVPNGKQLGVGGAMDLVTGAKKVIIAMQHTSGNGKPKLLKRCTLPVTGFGEADMVVTERAVFYLENGKITLHEIAPDITLEELKKITEADFAISPKLKTMEI